jgi:hypothetical protein
MQGSVKRAVGLAIAMALLAAAPAVAQAPPTLSGEIFTTHTAFDEPTAGTCVTDPDTGNTTFSMSFTGIAVGPYSGTYTEDITATIGPAGPPIPIGPFPDANPDALPGLGDSSVGAGQLLTLTANFTINSPSGTVVGQKVLSAVVPADQTHAGACAVLDPSVPPGASGGYRDVRAFDLTYSATITTPDGQFHDEGTSRLQARKGIFNVGTSIFMLVNDLGEDFASSLTGTIPLNEPRRGKGCGDANHVHEREDECKKIRLDDGVMVPN